VFIAALVIAAWGALQRKKRGDFLFSRAREPAMSSRRKHSLGTYMAAAVPPAVRDYMAKVADAYEAEGVSLKRQRDFARRRLRDF
jgi:hypothetical protein